MSSINVNTSAMVALQTLRNTNSNLESVQNEISTGKKIANSTDNAAIWSIATVMEADVSSFEQVSDSLNLGAATVGVARSAAEQATGLLEDAKSLIVAANDPSISDADREKYQTDISELAGTIASIVDAASFNGQNLLKGAGNIEVLASLNRQDDGSVEAGRISVSRADLSTSAAVAGTAVTTGPGSVTAAGNGTVAAAGTATFTLDTAALTEDTEYAFDVNGTEVTYSASAGDTAESIADGIAAAITTAAVTDMTATSAAGVLTLTNGSAGSATLDITSVEAGAEAEGGLYGLTQLDVSDLPGAVAALDEIDALLQAAIDATAAFGSSQNRIDNQNEFVSILKDSLKTGIGAMTDANLEEASARLQSLQVQQQLGVQALSIANETPQTLLSLFQ